MGSPFVCAIGNFDGVHRGHQALIACAADFANEVGARLGVVLFAPHPRRFFQPNGDPFLLSSAEQRDEQLAALGVQKVFPIPFDAQTARTSAADFVNEILVRRLGVGGIVAGADFHFGAGREGDAAALERLGADAGLQVRIANLLKAPGTEKYGSSGARLAIQAGNMIAVAEILDRHWSVRGTVEKGEQRGRQIGFATANIVLGELIAPRAGVYATRVRIGEETYNAVSNYGRRPTVGSLYPLLETHIFDFNQDIYGAEIEVSFVDFLRDEQKFDGLDALKNQIKLDSDAAQKILKTL